MKTTLFAYVCLFLLVGCASEGTARKLTGVSVGMTKAEVVAVMGEPDTAAAQEGVEFLVYELTDGTDKGEAATCAAAGFLTLGLTYASEKCRGGNRDDYFVRLKQGRVDAYGRVGDFDSTKDPTINVNENIRIETE